MLQNMDANPAFYMANQVLLQFEAKDARFEEVFVPPKSEQLASLPEWLWHQISESLKERCKVEIAAGFQPVVSLFPSAGSRCTALVQLTLVESSNDPVPAIINTFRADTAFRRDYSNGAQAIVLSDISPNWFGGGAGQTIGTGGPGGPPTKPANNKALTGTPPTAGPFKFDALQSKFEAVNRDPLSSKVDVYILDTYSSNARSPAAIGTVDEWVQAAPSLLADLVDASGRPIYTVSDPYYDMSDHGLFIAGLIRNIAPQTNIYLVEVLNKYGVGSAMSVAAGFAKVRELREKRHQVVSPYIVNCSFTFAVPIGCDLIDPRYSPHFTIGLADFLIMLLTKDDPHWPARLFTSISQLEALDRNMPALCQIVAAAGNDSDRMYIRPARYPARLEHVLGVGAMEQGKRAKFSNRPDSPIEEGLMALGSVRSIFTTLFPVVDNGEVVPVSGGGSHPLEGAVDTVPGDGVADWSGTSFAAPVIAGLLAKLVSETGETLPSAERILRDSEPKPPTPSDGFELETGGEIVTAKQQ